MQEATKEQVLWSAPFSVDPEGKKTLVIHCGDGRFVEPTHRFLHEHLKIRNYDLISVPGAVHFLVSALYPKFQWVGRRWLKFFLKHHETRRIVTFGHRDCGWYKAIYAVEEYTDKLFKAQQYDAGSVAATLTDLGTGITFEHYFVYFNDKKVVVSTFV